MTEPVKAPITFKVLDLSTGHVSPETAMDLDFATDNSTDYPVTLVAMEHGWLVQVPADPALSLAGNPDMHLDLLAVLIYACIWECAWVMFDSDGEMNPDLIYWDW